MYGVISTELPCLTADNFESLLASDDVLVHFFNDLLSQPSFPEALVYNRQTQLFEVLSKAAGFVSSRIRAALHYSRSLLLMGDLTALTTTPPVENHYTVCSLDREEGIQWILRERLPFFLQSDCYHEYRLAKLSLQWGSNVFMHRRSTSAPPLNPCPQFNGNNAQDPSSPKQGGAGVPDITCFFLGQRRHFTAETSDLSRCFSSCCEPENPNLFTSLSGFPSSHPKYVEEQKPESSQTESRLRYAGSTAGVGEEQHLREPSGQICESLNQQLEYLAARVVKEVLKDVVNVMDGWNWANTSGCLKQSGTRLDKPSECSAACRHSADKDGEIFQRKEKVQDGKRGSEGEEKTEWGRKKREAGSPGSDQENVRDIRCHGACCQGYWPGLDEFREFLRGTPGEKLINLWTDIERLKATQNKERKNRYLVLMRRRYLMGSSQSSLNVELLSRLGLTTSPCWTEEKLGSIQPSLAESLLYYWAPRFWTSRCVRGPLSGTPSCCSPSALLYPQCDTGLTPSSHTPDTPVLCSRGIEKMLQALCSDSRAGFYFTQFCEQSGNQLWVNALYFWTDLQHYHQLFYQDGLDPYQVQREAQLLYSTYIFSCARRSLGVDEDMRKGVYDHLMPAFEELFDGVEEHTLHILLEAWTRRVNKDRESFQRVCVQEEVRRLDSQEFRELQSLYEESERQLKQLERCQSGLVASSITPLSKSRCASESWSSVSPDYHGYRLGSLLRHRHEIGHFMSFLRNQDASIHLMCWLDLEQYRKTSRRDKEVRQERSTHIATKYLNASYFFSSDSPATTEQQNDILRLAGGLDRLKLQCLSSPVVVEIQDIVRSHIEETWLPLFLSTAEFTERQKHKPKLHAADRPSQHVQHRRRARREAWKAEGLWMSSSKEILLFRRVLLNPVSCQQFQHFVSLKGDFLENDVLFWLEVQRYKDLCHSHCDEATIQLKISTIISCFINSSTPPTLQIDITPEQAQQILVKRHELGPYIFREAQMSVFSELLKLWPGFQEFSSSVEEEQLLPLLQEKRVKHIAKVRRQRRKEEEEEEEDERRRAQEELERQESSSREEDESDGDETEEEPGSDGKQSRTPSRVLLTPTQPLLWSYSKYMAGLKREEVLLRRQSQLETSLHTVSDSSTTCSTQSLSSERSYRQASQRSSSKQCDRHSGGKSSSGKEKRL